MSTILLHSCSNTNYKRVLSIKSILHNNTHLNNKDYLAADWDLVNNFYNCSSSK